MKLTNKLLIASLAVVWLSVFIEYETFAFLSKTDQSDEPQLSEERRIRAVRTVLYSRSSDKNKNPNSRVKGAIKNKVKDKARKLNPFRRKTSANGVTKNTRVKDALKNKVKDKFRSKSKTSKYPHQPNNYPQQPNNYPQQPNNFPQQPNNYPQQPYNRYDNNQYDNRYNNDGYNNQYDNNRYGNDRYDDRYRKKSNSSRWGAIVGFVFFAIAIAVCCCCGCFVFYWCTCKNGYSEANQTENNANEEAIEMESEKPVENTE